MRRILLVDGTNVVMRYAHAMLPAGMIDQTDTPIVHEHASGIFAAVERAIRECASVAGCAYAIVALDSGESWRKELFPEYKAARTVRTGWWGGGLTARLAASGIRCARADRFEADDVIATLAFRANAAGHRVAVLSGDSDMLVLASEDCDVYQFGRKGEARYVKRTPEWIADHYGIAEPKHLRAFKAIVGEPGDGLPGIAGYGPVKARQLLARFGSAEGIYQSVALTREHHERFTLMLNLVALRTDAPVDAITPALCRLEAA